MGRLTLIKIVVILQNSKSPKTLNTESEIFVQADRVSHYLH